MTLKNTTIHFLVSLLKKRKLPEGERKRILIVSTTALGDTLWGTPAIKALRETFPTTYIAALTSPIGREVLLHNRHLDELFVMQDPALRSLASLYKELKQKQFTHALVFHTSQRPVLPCLSLLGIPHIVGTKGMHKGLDALLTVALPQEPVHEIQRRLRITSQMGVHALYPEMELFLSAEDEKLAEHWLSRHCPDRFLPRIVLHPGGKDRFKQWPASHFAAVGKRLALELGAQIFVTGTPGEAALVDAIARDIPGAHGITHFPLRTLGAFLKRVHLLISNDTGPMHVACAMHVPTVALFAPTDPTLCGPYFARAAHIIAKPPTCTPCLKKRCQAPFCMLQIGVEEVYNTTLKLFLEVQKEKREAGSELGASQDILNH